MMLPNSTRCSCTVNYVFIQMFACAAVHLQGSRWKQVRNVVHWSPFVQTYKKQKYPWIQLSGHQGKHRATHETLSAVTVCLHYLTFVLFHSGRIQETSSRADTEPS